MPGPTYKGKTTRKKVKRKPAPSGFANAREAGMYGGSEKEQRRKAAKIERGLRARRRTSAVDRYRRLGPDRVSAREEAIALRTMAREATTPEEWRKLQEESATGFALPELEKGIEARRESDPAKSEGDGGSFVGDALEVLMEVDRYARKAGPGMAAFDLAKNAAKNVPSVTNIQAPAAFDFSQSLGTPRNKNKNLQEDIDEASLLAGAGAAARLAQQAARRGAQALGPRLGKVVGEAAEEGAKKGAQGGGSGIRGTTSRAGQTTRTKVKRVTEPVAKSKPVQKAPPPVKAAGRGAAKTAKAVGRNVGRRKLAYLAGPGALGAYGAVKSGDPADLITDPAEVAGAVAKGVVSDPVQTAESSMAALIGVTGAIGEMLAAPILSTKRAADRATGQDDYTAEEIAAPTVNMTKKQLDGLQEYFDTFTSGDSEKMEKAVIEEYGVTPIASVAPMGIKPFVGAGKKARAGARKTAARIRTNRNNDPYDPDRPVFLFFERREGRVSVAVNFGQAILGKRIERSKAKKGIEKPAARAKRGMPVDEREMPYTPTAKELESGVRRKPLKVEVGADSALYEVVNFGLQRDRAALRRWVDDQLPAQERLAAKRTEPLRDGAVPREWSLQYLDRHLDEIVANDDFWNAAQRITDQIARPKAEGGRGTSEVANARAVGETRTDGQGRFDPIPQPEERVGLRTRLATGERLRADAEAKILAKEKQLKAVQGAIRDASRRGNSKELKALEKKANQIQRRRDNLVGELRQIEKSVGRQSRSSVANAPNAEAFSNLRVTKSSDKFAPGDVISGTRVIPTSDLPETLYHVTTNLDGINSTRIIRTSSGDGGGGLGGSHRGSVSLTVNRQIANQLADDMRFFADLMRSTSVEEVVAKALAAIERYGLDQTQGVSRRLRNPEYLAKRTPEQLANEFSTAFFNERLSQRGIPNPIITGRDKTSWGKIDPRNISVVEVRREQLNPKAVVTDFDLGQGGLEEVRFYGDIDTKVGKVRLDDLSLNRRRAEELSTLEADLTATRQEARTLREEERAAARDDVAALRDEAKTLGTQVREGRAGLREPVSDAVKREYIAEVQAYADSVGIRADRWLGQRSATVKSDMMPLGGVDNLVESSRVGRQKGEKPRTGALSRQGNVDNSYEALMNASVDIPVERNATFRAIANSLFPYRFRPVEGMDRYTSQESLALIREGRVDPKRYTPLPYQVEKRVADFMERRGEDLGAEDIQAAVGQVEGAITAADKLTSRKGRKMPADEAWRVYEDSIDQSIRTRLEDIDTPQDRIAEVLNENRQGREYSFYPVERVREVQRQLAPIGGGFAGWSMRGATLLNKAASLLLLGTSPVWLSIQFLAETLQGASAISATGVPTPVSIYKLWLGKANREWQKLSPDEQLRLMAAAGEAPGIDQPLTGLRSGFAEGFIETADNSLNIFKAYGLLEGIKRLMTLKTLGDIDRWKTSVIRRGVAANYLDKRLNSFGANMKATFDLQDEIYKELRGKSLREQMEYFATNQKANVQLANYMRDLMGDWYYLTSLERAPAAVLMFYPYLRMSLRYTFWGLPKNHPVKWAILTTLGAANSEQLRDLLGNDPGFIADYATVSLMGGESTPDNPYGVTSNLDFSRAVPGANAFVEAVMGDNPEKAPLTMVNPAYQAVTTGLLGAQGFGEDVEGSVTDKMRAALISLLSLPMQIRAADQLNIRDNPIKDLKLPGPSVVDDVAGSILRFGGDAYEEIGEFVNAGESANTEAYKNATERNALSLLGPAYRPKSLRAARTEVAYQELFKKAGAMYELEDLMQSKIKPLEDALREAKATGRTAEFNRLKEEAIALRKEAYATYKRGRLAKAELDRLAKAYGPKWYRLASERDDQDIGPDIDDLYTAFSGGKLLPMEQFDKFLSRLIKRKELGTPAYRRRVRRLRNSWKPMEDWPQGFEPIGRDPWAPVEEPIWKVNEDRGQWSPKIN